MYQPRYARVFTCRVRDVKAFVVPDDGRLSRETTFPLILRRVPLLVLVQPLPNSTLALSDRDRERERERERWQGEKPWKGYISKRVGSVDFVGWTTDQLIRGGSATFHRGRWEGELRAHAFLCKLKRLHGFTYFNRFAADEAGKTREKWRGMRRRRGPGSHSKTAGEAFCRVFYGKL